MNIDDFWIEMDDDFFIDCYRLPAIPIDFVNRWFSDFDFYRFPISIDINRQIESINTDDIDLFPISIFIH